MRGERAGAKVAAAQVVRLDPNWSVEKYLSEGGGYPDGAATLFVEAARKGGDTACVPADKVSSLPNLIHIKACVEERTHQAPGERLRPAHQSVAPCLCFANVPLMAPSRHAQCTDECPLSGYTGHDANGARCLLM